MFISTLFSDFLKIGIPTLSRTGPPYILDTLKSLVAHAEETDMKDTAIVVQISDNNKTFLDLISRKIAKDFSPQLENGFIQVTQVNETSYPTLTGLKQNYGDSEMRVKWRSKQNIDVVYLMSYCFSKSLFYLHLEDDVISAPNYIKNIKDYIKTVSKPWTMLEFSSLGAIAKLFRNEDLKVVSNLLKNYYQEQPVDFLFNFHVSLTAQPQRFLRVPTLFRHVGHVSSLTNQTREYVDNLFFDFEPKIWKTVNPKAVIWTSLNTFNNFTIDKAYSDDPLGFFWGFSSNDTDFIVIIFDMPQVIDRISIKTGVKTEQTRDTISTGYLEFSTDTPLLTDGKPDCRHYELLNKFNNGMINVSNVSDRENGPYLVTCLKVTIFKMPQEWVFIQDISVSRET